MISTSPFLSLLKKKLVQNGPASQLACYYHLYLVRYVLVDLGFYGK